MARATALRIPIAAAFLSVLLAGVFQWALVHVAFQGNWTGLFCAGDRFSRPPEIQYGEYVFRDVAGYDGQFEQLIAHDPFFQRNYAAFIDAPKLRYRRILMPGLAWLLAVGRPGLIDRAYYAVCWMFVGLGTFCLAQLAVRANRSPWWGLLFLLTPATLSGIERMTIDISLSALIAATILVAHRQRWLLLWFTLAAVLCSKEIGLLVIIAVVVWLAREKRFVLAAGLSTSVIPALAWYLFVQNHTGSDYRDFSMNPAAFFAPLMAPLPPGVLSILFRIAAAAAVAGLLWSAVRSLILVAQNRFRELELLLCFGFAALLLVFESESVWFEPNGFTRVYSPLLICLIAATWKKGFAQTLAAFAIVTCPLCLQLAAHLIGPLWHLV